MKKDITEKLSFEGNPVLVIRGKELEVNADAPTMLKVMGIMGDENPGLKEITEAYDLLFPKESKRAIETLKLGFKDLVVVIQEGIQLIVGEETAPGEQ